MDPVRHGWEGPRHSRCGWDISPWTRLSARSFFMAQSYSAPGFAQAVEALPTELTGQPGTHRQCPPAAPVLMSVAVKSLFPSPSPPAPKSAGCDSSTAFSGSQSPDTRRRSCLNPSHAPFHYFWGFLYSPREYFIVPSALHN